MKRVLFVILTIITCCVIAIPALADPPANDDCANATVIGDGILQSGTPMEFSGSNVDATSDCSENNYPEVWLKFTTEAPMDITVSYEGTDPAFEESYISGYLFDSCPCGAGMGNALDISYDDGNIGRIWLGLPAGIYYFPVFMRENYASGDYLVTVSGVELDSPENDDCENATVVDDGVIEIGETVTFTGDNSGTTIDCENNSLPEAWIKFTINEATDITIDYCGTSPAFYDANEYLYDSCPCGEPVNSDSYNSCGDGNPGNLWYSLSAGTYWYPIKRTISSEGEYTINVSAISLTGACCYEDGQSTECLRTYETICSEEYEGTWMGLESSCGEYDEETGWSGCQQPTTGACCYDDGFGCVDTDEETCSDEYEGTWMGEGTECGGYSEETGYQGCQQPSTTGACCYDDGLGCAETDEVACYNEYNGTWMGLETICRDENENGISDICEQPSTGACCYDDGFGCADTDEETCSDEYEGTWMGEGTECGGYSEETGWQGCQQPSTTGACCYEDGYSCVDTDEETCSDEYGGTWMGEETECGGYSEETGYEGCQQQSTTGACCFEDGMACLDNIEEANCIENEGTWMGAGTECGGYSEETGYEGCQQQSTTGACCYEDGYSCVDTDEETCSDTYEGTWMGEGTECGGYSEETGYEGCQQQSTTGACCYNDGFGCADTDEETCSDTYEGTWMGEGTECGGYSEEVGYEGCQQGTSYEYLPGDANMAAETWPAQTIGGDVTYLVNYFRGLADPCKLDDFYASADATGDCMVVGGDVTYLVNYFRGLADLSYCADYEPAWPTPSDVPADAPDGWPNCD